MLAAKPNPPLSLHKPKRTVLLRLWKSDIFQSIHPNRDLAARDIVGNSMLCPFMSGYNNGTFCSCHGFWQQICLFEVENNYNSSICVTWVWAVGFALYLSVRTCVASEELMYIHTTWRACFEHQTFNKSVGLRFYWLAKTLQHLWWIHPFPLLTFIFCNIGMQDRL